MAKANEFCLNGIVPIIPTPFTVGEQVDWPSLSRLIDFACAAGACAICLPAYASEFYKLSEGERLRLVTEAVRHTAGRIPVFAQVNFVSVRQAVETARAAQEAGASAIAAASRAWATVWGRSPNGSSTGWNRDSRSSWRKAHADSLPD